MAALSLQQQKQSPFDRLRQTDNYGKINHVHDILRGNRIYLAEKYYLCTQLNDKTREEDGNNRITSSRREPGHESEAGLQDADGRGIGEGAE